MAATIEARVGGPNMRLGFAGDLLHGLVEALGSACGDGAERRPVPWTIVG